MTRMPSASASASCLRRRSACEVDDAPWPKRARARASRTIPVQLTQQRAVSISTLISLFRISRVTQWYFVEEGTYTDRIGEARRSHLDGEEISPALCYSQIKGKVTETNLLQYSPEGGEFLAGQPNPGRKGRNMIRITRRVRSRLRVHRLVFSWTREESWVDSSRENAQEISEVAAEGTWPINPSVCPPKGTRSASTPDWLG